MTSIESQNFLRVLVDPKDPNADIIAIHGLNTTNTRLHAEAAWTSNDKLWLRDFLPSSLPNARILLFGYNANVAFETSTAGVLEQAKNLLNLIKLDRVNNTDRPIVFIAHSLGGIIAKRALVEAELDHSHKATRAATYGIAFFGTPHRGGRNVKLGSFAASIIRGPWAPSNTFVEVLKKDSLFADALQNDFQHQLEDYKVLSFYETRPMGKLGLVVARESAILGLPGTREVQIPMDADHVGICKFANADTNGYKQVASNLVELVRYAVEVAAERTLKAPVPSTVLAEADQKCLHALQSTNPRLDKSRIEATRDPLLEESCSWIFEDPSFLHWWDCDDDPVLWIHGDPGKGKTMMMIAIIAELTKRLKAEPSKPGLLAYFFCQNTDQRLNTTTAVLRGLIFMLLRQQTTLMHHLRKRYEEAGDSFLQGPNSVYALLDLIFSVLEDPKLPTVYLMVDALDECDADIHQFIDRIARNQSSSGKVKWVMTSRNEPAFKQQLEYDGQLHTSLELNSAHVSRAVGSFIDHKVNDLTRRKQYTKELSTYVKDSLIQKAEGTFLWAALVCKALKNVATWKTKSAIEKFPPGLEPLYDRMMAQLRDGGDEDDVALYEQMIRSIALVCRPLSLAELPVLARLPEELHGNREILQDLITRCGSFLTVRQDTVYLVHQSAKDYFSTGSGKRIFSAGQPVEHAEIMRLCFKLMADNLKRDICDLRVPGISTDEIDSSLVERCLPLTTQYACLYWFEHLRQAVDDNFFRDDSLVHQFYQRQLLSWLEALSFMKKLSEGLSVVRQLEAMLNSDSGPTVREWTYDTKRFILEFSNIIAKAPLQVYDSALVFAPNRSLIKRNFSAQLPRYLKRSPEVEDNWSTSLQTLEGHEDAISNVVFSPNGQLLVSNGFDHTTRVWNPRTGGLLRKLEGHTDLVPTSHFSPDGRLLVSCSYDSTVRIWDPSTGEGLGTFKGHTGAVYTVAFSPDGCLLASGSEDCTVRLWDSSTYEVQHVFVGHAKMVQGVQFSPNGRILASSSVDRSVRLWDPDSGEPRCTLKGHADLIHSFSFSHDGQLLACGYFDGTIGLWNSITGETHGELKGHTGQIHIVAFSPFGQLLATGSMDRTVRLWDSGTEEALFTLGGHSDYVGMVAFAPDGRTLASVSGDHTIRLWDVTTGETCGILKGHTSQIKAIAFSPDGHVLASGSFDRTVRLWDLDNKGMESATDEHRGVVSAIASSEDDRLLAIGYTNGLLRLWDSRTEKVKCTFEGHTNRILTIAFSPDGQLLVSSSFDKTVRLWGISTEDARGIYEEDGSPIYLVAFSHNSQLLVYVVDDIIQLRTSSTGEPCDVLQGYTDSIFAVEFSPDDQLLASGSLDGKVQLWDVRTCEIRNTLEGIGSAFSFAFSPDGKLLACGLGNGDIHVKGHVGDEIHHMLKGHTGMVTKLVFSTDGQLLASVCRDYAVRLWDLRTGSQLKQVAPYDIKKMSFSVDGIYLKTNCGLIRTIPRQSCSPDPLLSLCRWTLQREWVCYDTRRVLWLPAEFRPDRSMHLGATDNGFALALSSGKVVVFDLEPKPDFLNDLE